MEIKLKKQIEEIDNIFDDFFIKLSNNPSCSIKGKDSARSIRAKASEVKMTKDKNQIAIRNERKVAKAIKGTWLKNNEPMDVLYMKGGRLNGIELKTIIDGKNNKITMHPPSLKRKKKWIKDNKKSIGHTVVVKEKTGDIFYRKGFGSFTLKNMEKVDGGYSGLAKKLGIAKEKIK